MKGIFPDPAAPTPQPDGGGETLPAPQQPAAPPAVAEETIEPPTLPQMAPPQRYTTRFAVAYVALGLALAGAIAAFVVLVIRPGHTPTPAWSSWSPAQASSSDMIKQISTHVAQEYRLTRTGGELVAVVPREASVTSGTTNISIKAVAIRKQPDSNAGIAVDLNPPEMYQLCGLGQNCSIASGTPSTTRGRLVRREALEIALYTFKFVPSVKSIAAFMPPPPGQTANEMLYFQKNDVAPELSQPLSKTLSSALTPLPTNPDTSEAPTIDRLTLPYLYTYQLQALQAGGAALILDPAT
jgi:hypothetical protein